MVFGLALGLVAGGAVYFGVLSTAEDTAVATTEPGPEAPIAPEEPEERSATRRDGSAPPPPPLEQPAGPRFDFYEILPQFEVVIPEKEAPASRSAPEPRAVEEPGSYALQAGSFSALSDADRLKARIALLGVESRIERVTISGDVFHRVRIGPISDLDRLNRIRRQLRDARVETMVMKAQ
jgi:cell division protein FtsN